MTEVSMTRLYVMRATYLLIAVGQAVFFWPKMISHTSQWALKFGDTSALLVGMSVLMALGVKYPLKMLPILLFEFVWKTIWMAAIFYPLWRAGQIDAATRESCFSVGMGIVICAFAIPWGYVIKHYVKHPAEAWGNQGADQQTSASQASPR